RPTASTAGAGGGLSHGSHSFNAQRQPGSAAALDSVSLVASRLIWRAASPLTCGSPLALGFSLAMGFSTFLADFGAGSVRRRQVCRDEAADLAFCQIR